MSVLATQIARHRTIATFLMLSGFAGLTIGMLKVLCTLYAIRLGATSFQIGVISGAESFTMAFMTLPAGLVVARFGPRRTYLVASFGAMAVYLLAPAAHSWIWLAIAVACGGCCIPFRIVSMTGSFMEQLKVLGQGKAGWYRGSQVVGMVALGPLLGTLVLERFGIVIGYWSVALMFGVMALAGLGILGDRPAVIPPQLRENIREMLGLLRHPVVAGVCMIEVSSSVVFAFFSAFIILVAVRELGLSEPAAVTIRFFEGAVSVGTLFLAGPLLRELPARLLYQVSLVLIVGGLVALGGAFSYWRLVAATTILGVGLGITNIVNVQQLAKLEQNKSKMASLQLLSSMGGNCIGGVVGGSLALQLGLHGLFYFGALLYAVLSLRWCLPERLRARRGVTAET
jgi:MFS family permease